MAEVALAVAKALMAHIDAQINAGHVIGDEIKAFGFERLVEADNGKVPYLTIESPVTRLLQESRFSETYGAAVTLIIYCNHGELSNVVGIVYDCLEGVRRNPDILSGFMDSPFFAQSVRFTGGGVRQFTQSIWQARIVGDLRVSRVK